jgi:catechol 2,3-dioxygenase-like lactoylglutathione lyase family enzyme
MVSAVISVEGHMKHSATEHVGGWPMHLHPGALRWTWASSHYEDTISFYRDVVGLPVIGEFTHSFGEDGTVFGLPDTGTQVEIVRAHGDRGHRGAFDQLVLYLDDADAVTAATAPLLEHGFRPDPERHAYWQANGAVVHRDPDGRALVFAPWVYGRDPDPFDRHSSGPRPAAGGESVQLRGHGDDKSRP